MRVVDVSIRKRLWAAVALPMVAAGYLAYAQSADRFQTYSDMREIVTVSQEMVVLSDIVHSLQVERGLTAGFLGSHGANNRVELQSARATSDAATARFAASMDNLGAAVEADISASGRQFTAKLSAIADMRRSVDAFAAAGGDVFTAYTDAIGTIVALAGDLSALTGDAVITQRMTAYVQVMQAKEMAGQERALGNGFIVAGRMDPARFDRFTGLAGMQDALVGS